MSQCPTVTWRVTYIAYRGKVNLLRLRSQQLPCLYTTVGGFQILYFAGYRSTSSAKFPSLHKDDSIPPPATRENPGQVTHPKSPWELIFVEFPIVRSIHKSTLLVSPFHCDRSLLEPSNTFTCRLATQTGSSGSDNGKERYSNVYHSNPHHFQAGLNRLGDALDDVIATIEQETTNPGRTGDQNGLLLKFKGWRHELSAVRTGAGDRLGHRLDMSDGVPAEMGGIFSD